MAILEARGTVSASQFWPEGSSDADTVKILVHQVRYAGRPTRVFDDAIVMPIGKPPIDALGRMTVRLEGIDAPELHYLRLSITFHPSISGHRRGADMG